MASIFNAAKQMINKISDDINKDKWDKSCINQALFTDPEPGKLVPPARQDSRPVPPEKTVNVQPAAVPAPAENHVNAQAVTVAAANTAAPLVATAPQIEYNTDKPQVKQSVAAAEPEKKEPVRFINSRFNRSINYVTSKVVKPAGGVRSISDLPVVDPSQSISNISGMTLGAGGEPIPEEAPAAPAAAPAAEVQPAAQPATAKPAASQPSPAVAAAMLAAAQLAAQQSAAAAPVQTAPIQQQPMAVPMQQPIQQQVAAAPMQQVAAQAVQPMMTQPVQPAQPTIAAMEMQPAATVQVQPVPASIPAQPVIEAQPVAVQPVMAEPVMEQPAPVVAETQPVEAAEEEVEKCYYVLITHTKTQPAEGKCVLMRNCDYQYAWTDSMDESEKPSYDTCPVCGKPIEYIETEMD